MNTRINFMVLKGIIFATLALILYISIPFQIKTTEAGVINASTFPSFLLIIMFTCSILLIVKGLLSKKKKYIELNKSSLSRWKIPLISFVFFGVYLISIEKIGFLVATISASTLCLLLLKCKKWYYYAFCIVLSILVFVIFRYVLDVYLPTWSL